MSHEAMKVEQSQPSRAQLLQNLTTGPLASSISKLSGSSRAIPSKEDFYYYHNFDEFKVPIEEIARQSQSMLESIGSSAPTWGKEMTFPQEDMDDAYDWLVNVNDEVLERFDASVDEFKRIRKEDEETKRPVTAVVDSENGFQLVSGKKKKNDDSTQVKVVTKDKKTVGTKPKVSFHVPSIRKPQEQFNILVNNSNQPFEHVWLPRSEDAHRFLHPLEKLSILDFIDNGIGDVEPVKPPEIEATPFKLVEEVKDLKELAAKLRGVNEFAVDLEHNQYRSFQGLTCLMQISTRTEDFIVDTLKLKIHVGPYLRELFKDPSKRKVMHGADRDIVWLQRDFGIYICNLFDTGQASRVLKLERNSLEYLLHHFCDVSANKEYQNADWRFRPLTKEMVRYAREDTHYLLHIYDLMRTKLSSMPKESENSDTPLIEVYKRSYDICMHLYEKELFTENSYLHIYGLQGACFNSQQLAVVSGLCEWRDVVARTEDESTGYILPNKTLLELAKQMPDTTNKLRRLVKSKHPYIEQHLDSVVSVIRHSMQNAAFFEAAAEHLKVGRVESSEENILVRDRSESFLPVEYGCNSVNGDVSAPSPTTLPHREKFTECGCGASNGEGKVGCDSYVSVHPRHNIVTGQSKYREESSIGCSLDSAKVTGATVQVQKKPSCAFSALLGTAVPKKKFDADVKDEEDNKLEQIRSSVNFPFHSFSGRIEQPNPKMEEPGRVSEIPHSEVPIAVSPDMPSLEDFITLENGSHVPEHKDNNSGVPGAVEVPVVFAASQRTAREEVREHRKKQKVHVAVSTSQAGSADQAVKGASTALTTQSNDSGLVFGRTILPQNAQLFSCCVHKALTDPLPVDSLAGYPELSVMRQKEVFFQCKQKLAYEEQLLDRRYWNELQTANREVVSIQSAYDNLLRGKEELEARLARVEEEAGRKIIETEERASVYAREVEEKAKADVISETVRMQAKFDNHLESAVEEAVLAYRRDRGRAVEQATAYVEGGIYILGKIKEAFPEQDWSQLPAPELPVTKDMVEDEHKAILREIEEELTGASNQQQPKQH